MINSFNSPVWQDCKRDQENSESHSRTQKSWEPILDGSDELERVLCLQYPETNINLQNTYTQSEKLTLKNLRNQRELI